MFIGGTITLLLVVAEAVAIAWLAPIAVSLWTGRWILSRLRPQAAGGRIGPYVLGLAVYVILTGIPWVGGLVALFVAIWGLGA